MLPLFQALTAASPRLTPRPVPAFSLFIYLAIVVLWLTLGLQAFVTGGLFAWSVGIAYITYDTALLMFVAWQTRSLLRPVPKTTPGSQRLSLAVAVAAYNEAQVLPVTLKALFAQSDPADEILIVDDGSTDEIAEVLQAHYGLRPPHVGSLCDPSASFPTLRWLRLPHRGKAQALNAALVKLSADVVLTVDADTLLAPTAIAAMRDAFSAEPQLVAATGVLTPICGDGAGARLLQWFQTYEYIRNFISRYAWMHAHSLLLISGAFAGFRRNALVAVGGFDPECMVEDYEAIHRLHRYAAERGLDWRTRVLGTARALTDAPATIPAFLRQRRRWFAGFLQTQYWNRDMTGNARFGTLGRLMMPVKAADTLQPIYGLMAFALLIVFVADGKDGTVLPVLEVMAAKIAIDLSFYLWSIHLYRRWTGEKTSASFGYAILAALVEPFSFQLLRHAGAAWGWGLFLTRRQGWARERRLGVLAQR